MVPTGSVVWGERNLGLRLNKEAICIDSKFEAIRVEDNSCRMGEKGGSRPYKVLTSS